MARKENMKKWAIQRFIKTLESSEEEPIFDRKLADSRVDSLCRLAIIRAGLIGAISGLSLIHI